MIERGAVIVDGNLKRRAEIAHLLVQADFHVEPYESVADYRAYPLRAALYLVADDNNRVADMLGETALLEDHAPVIAYDEQPDLDKVVRAVSAGSSHYFEWPFEAERLDRVLARFEKRPMSLVAIRGRARRAQRKLQCLTGREYEILAHLARGLTNKEMARKIGISPRTVEIHRANLLTKLNAASSADVIRIAIESTPTEPEGTLPLSAAA